MISKKFLLEKISGFEGDKRLMVADQTTGDIIAAILTTHPKYVDDYAKIAKYFKGVNVKDTCKNIWEFLKNNIQYVIESEDEQFVRSPAAILKQGVSDCKCYSLFAGGICQALNIPFCYRFASYKAHIKEPGHVFIVVYPGTANEIWIDPVLSYFNYKKAYNYKLDKKPNMAVYSISGIGRTNRKAARQQRRAKRRAAGKGFGQRLKKGVKGVLKVAAAPARNAFLGLVALNVRGLATKLQKAYKTNPSKLSNFWGGFGGRIQALVNAINKGAKKKRLLGTEQNPNIIGVAIPTLIASAAPIIAAVTKFLKSVGIEPKDLVDVAKAGIQAKAKELIKKQMVVTETDTNTPEFEERQDEQEEGE